MKKDIMNIYKEKEIYPYDIDEMIYNGSPVKVNGLGCLLVYNYFNEDIV